MAAYRVYSLDGAGKVLSAEWIEAASDEEALESARCMNGAVRVELWQGQRLVGQITPGRREP